MGPASTETRRQTILVAVAALAAFFVAVAAIVAAVVVPSYLKGRLAADEAAAVTTLRSLASAEQTYHTLEGAYGAVPDLVGANLIDPEWENSRIRNGYRFSVEVAGGGAGFVLRADPLPESRNTRHFLLTEEMSLRFADGEPAGPASPEYGRAEASGES